jgi:hypothetical protein
MSFTAAAAGTSVDPASLLRWRIRNGYRFEERRRPASGIAGPYKRRARKIEVKLHRATSWNAR